jgi:hypothetical protein
MRVRKLLRDITHLNSTTCLCWQSNKEDREAHFLTLLLFLNFEACDQCCSLDESKDPTH